MATPILHNTPMFEQKDKRKERFLFFLKLKVRMKESVETCLLSIRRELDILNRLLEVEMMEYHPLLEVDQNTSSLCGKPKNKFI